MPLLSVCIVANAQQYGTLKDTRDGKVYKTVKIGEQVWMAENFDGTRFLNGDVIPQVSTLEGWSKAIKEKRPAWCYSLDGTKGTNKLYNVWAALDPRGLAPKGWRLPLSDDVWNLYNHFVPKPESPKKDSVKATNKKEKRDTSELIETEEGFVVKMEFEYDEPEPLLNLPMVDPDAGKKLRTIGWGEGTNESGFNAKYFPCLCGNNTKKIWSGKGNSTYWWMQKANNGSYQYMMLQEWGDYLIQKVDGGFTGVSTCSTSRYALSVRFIKE